MQKHSVIIVNKMCVVYIFNNVLAVMIDGGFSHCLLRLRIVAHLCSYVVDII